MLVTLPSEGMTLFLQPATKVLLAVSMMQFPALWYFLFPLSTVRLVRLSQQAKTPPSMLVTLSGIVMDVRLEHSQKAESPMLVTLLGIVMDARLEQRAKAEEPMLVTLSGIVMDVRLEQPEKAESPMQRVPSLIA